MKKWVTIIIIAVIVAGLWYLVDKGIIDWQPLTILFTVFAAPFKFVWNLFDDKIKKIQEEHAKVREHEAEWTEQTQEEIAERERRVESLNREIDELDVKLDQLREKRSKVDQEIGEMSLEELQRRGRDTFGD